jgi:hypothetical protein
MRLEDAVAVRLEDPDDFFLYFPFGHRLIPTDRRWTR